jgi:hypothetical protein
MAIGPLGDGIVRIASAFLDLTDDRTFLSAPSGSGRDAAQPVDPCGAGADPRRIRAGVGGASCELHVLLRPLPVGTDLVLGQCAMELLAAATARLMEQDGAAE